MGLFVWDPKRSVQTYTNPNFGNKYGDDFNLEEVQEKIKQHQKEQKEKWTTDHK